jgi:hypothetical protein
MDLLMNKKKKIIDWNNLFFNNLRVSCCGTLGDEFVVPVLIRLDGGLVISSSKFCSEGL